MQREGDYWYFYRGYRIWKFDGYYDVHDGRKDCNLQPIAEGLHTAKEAREFIDEWIKDERFERALEGMLRKARY